MRIKNSIPVLLGISALALALRVLFIYQFRDSPAFGFYSADARHYDQFALKILGGNLSFKESVFLNPIYPLFLAAVYKVFGHSLQAVAFCQALIDAATAAIIYLLCLKVFRRIAVAAVAALAYACYGVALFYAGLMTEATLAAFFLTVAVLFVVLADGRDRMRAWSFAAGAAFAIAALLRPNAVFAVPVAAIWLYGRRSRTFGANTSRALAICAGVLLVALPFAMRNHATTGTCSPFPANGGISFYIGNSPGATGYYVPIKGIPNSPLEQARRSVALASAEAGSELSAYAASNHWLTKGLKFAAADPARYIRLMWRKARLFWNKAEIPANENFALAAARAPMLKLPLASFGAIAPFALVGMIFMWAGRVQGQSLLPSTLLAYMASLLVFYVTSRYRFPCVPLVAALAGYGACESVSRLMRPGRLSRFAIPAAIAAAAVFVNIDMPVPEPADNLAADHNNLGVSLYEKGDIRGAVAQYLNALSIDPGYACAHNNLASAYYRLGDRARAADSCRRAIAADPGFAEAYYTLANIHSDVGEYAKAAPLYEKAIELDPELVEAYNNLAYAYLGMGKAAEAESLFRRAIARDPSYAAAYNNLGILCARDGRIDEAKASFRKALAIKPDYPDARRNLEKALGASGG